VFVETFPARTSKMLKHYWLAAVHRNAAIFEFMFHDDISNGSGVIALTNIQGEAK